MRGGRLRLSRFDQGAHAGDEIIAQYPAGAIGIELGKNRVRPCRQHARRYVQGRESVLELGLRDEAG